MGGRTLELLEIMHKKLREAGYFLNQMNAVVQRVVGDPEEFEFLLSGLLSASRSITDSLENRRYRTWYETWKTGRTAAEQELLEFMRVQRNSEVHHDGADVEVALQKVPITEIHTGTRGHPAYGFHWWAPPGTLAPTVDLNAHQFELGGTKVEAFATCRDFIRLLGELVAAFEATHPRP